MVKGTHLILKSPGLKLYDLVGCIRWVECVLGGGKGIADQPMYYNNSTVITLVLY